MCELMKRQMRNFPLFFHISISIYKMYPTCIPQSVTLFDNLWTRLNYSRTLFQMFLCLRFKVMKPRFIYDDQQIKQTVDMFKIYMNLGLPNQVITFHIETDLFKIMFFRRVHMVQLLFQIKCKMIKTIKTMRFLLGLVKIRIYPPFFKIHFH